MLTVYGMVVLLAAGSVAYPGGAPSSVCNDPSMKPTLHETLYNATGINNTDPTNTNYYTLSSQKVQGNLIEGEPMQLFNDLNINKKFPKLCINVKRKGQNQT